MQVRLPRVPSFGRGVVPCLVVRVNVTSLRQTLAHADPAVRSRRDPEEGAELGLQGGRRIESSDGVNTALELGRWDDLLGRQTGQNIRALWQIRKSEKRSPLDSRIHAESAIT